MSCDRVLASIGVGRWGAEELRRGERKKGWGAEGAEGAGEAEEAGGAEKEEQPWHYHKYLSLQILTKQTLLWTDVR
ncbi:MAG: hypothetical protein F6J92_31105 [Symploca sp. SIO1A3]|nr:hypothetical protein [Symploca sp. SIO1A3]